MAQVLDHAEAGARLDTTDAGGDGALGEDLQQADVVYPVDSETPRGDFSAVGKIGIKGRALAGDHVTGRDHLAFWALTQAR